MCFASMDKAENLDFFLKQADIYYTWQVEFFGGSFLL